MFEVANCDLKKGTKKRMGRKSTQLSIPEIENKIYLIRNDKVMLDSDLAELYGVTTKRLNQQVGRNLHRFPKDFMFRLTKKEYRNLRLQFATSSSDHGGRRTPPHVFTEHGAIMLASVLNSERAIETSILVVRAFVRFREMISERKEIAKKITELEKRLAGHDNDIQAIVATIRQLMTTPSPRKRQIGFENR